MAQFAGMPLHSSGGRSGALLPLVEKSPIGVALPLAGGLEIEVSKDVAYCLVRGFDEASYESLMGGAPEMANRALDILSMKGVAHLAVGGIETGHVAWWHDDGISTIRFASTARLEISASASGVVTDADGNVRPPEPKPIPTWQESMRYYRASQVTTDLFDAFRNVYLALESLLSSVEPIQRTSDGRAAERESKWFKRALRAVGQSVDLSKFTRVPSSDPVSQIHEELHDRVRNRVFHAKDGMGPYLPQDLVSRSSVSEALDRYSRLYLAAAESVFGGPFATGGTSLGRAGRDAVLQAVTTDRQIGFTPDTAPFDRSDTLLSPHGHPCVSLPASPVADPRGDAYLTLKASVAVADVGTKATCVGRYGTIDGEGRVAVIEPLGQQLSLEGFDRCEFIISHHVIGRQNRKSRYQT